MYNVYQHWDRLKVMMVGKSYPPELYDYIKNDEVRRVFYKIAEETEEDYQKLISLLESFDVKVVRSDISTELEYAYLAIKNKNKINSPSMIMQPRDNTIMIGSNFFTFDYSFMKSAISLVKENNATIRNHEFIKTYQFGSMYTNSAMISRVGKDLYIGTVFNESEKTTNQEVENIYSRFSKLLPEYRIHVVDTCGHTDGTFCPVVPNLILSIESPINYQQTFPNWEVVYLPNESWSKIKPWQKLKSINRGKWWVPGEELNADFTHYVTQWMDHWVGYVEESVFDVNMIVVDKKNVIVNGYNKQAFDAFDRYGITPHICNFRHRYFWDGGLHCITSDLHREGVMEDYFPERS